MPGRLPANSRRVIPITKIGIEGREKKLKKEIIFVRTILKCELFWCHFGAERTPVS